jgi:hypothetical protein
MTALIELMGDGVTSLCPVRSAIRASLRRLLTWVRLLAVLALPLPAITAADPAIHSGELHSPRIPREYWQHRLQMAKALGLNTVSTYVFWSQHEPEPGKFDWTGQNDIAEFCRQAQREGLQVLIRPGPYVCAEYDQGGMPWWLLKDRDMRLRSRHPAYLHAVRRYYKALGEQLAPLQASRGGPIAMAQSKWGLESSSSGHPAVMRFKGANVPDFLSLSAPQRLRARFLLHECRVSDWCSGALLSGGDGYGVRGGQGFCRPCRGWVFMGGRNPALTRWAIVCWPSGPGGHGFGGREAAEVYWDRSRSLSGPSRRCFVRAGHRWVGFELES